MMSNLKDKKEIVLKKIRNWRLRRESKMNRVLDYLWIGGLRNATDKQEILDNQIAAIVTIIDFCNVTHDGIENLHIKLFDMPEENAISRFSQVNSFIHSFRLQKKNVLVHCVAGISRSVCFVVAYIMSVVPTLDYATALAYVGRKRLCAQPNVGFRMQLQTFGKCHVDEERLRLTSEFAHSAEAFKELQKNDSINTSTL